MNVAQLSYLAEPIIRQHFEDSLFVAPAKTECRIQKHMHPGIAGWAFEILFFLFAASKYSRRKSRSLQFQEKLMYEYTSWSYQMRGWKENFDVVKEFLETKDLSDDVLEYVYKTAGKRQDSFAEIIESQVRPPTTDELNELRQLWAWIEQLNLNITELYYTDIARTFGTPDLLFKHRGKGVVAEFKVVGAFHHYSEHILQALVYYFAASVLYQPTEVRFSEIWIIYPRQGVVHKILPEQHLRSQPGNITAISQKIIRKIKASKAFRKKRGSW